MLTEHIRLNALYWALTSLHLLGRPDALPQNETIDFVLSCQTESGGFGAAPGYDAHLLCTCYAVQVLAMVDRLVELDQRGKAGGTMAVGRCTFILQNVELKFTINNGVRYRGPAESRDRNLRRR